VDTSANMSLSSKERKARRELKNRKELEEEEREKML
jgi:hypothetical protein